jgi:small-conductance mechanosensitive channel
MPFISNLKVQLFAIIFSSVFGFCSAQDSLVKVQDEIYFGSLPLNTDSSGVAVFVERDTLFHIYQSAGSVQVSERAAIINQRLTLLHSTYSSEADSILFEKIKDRYLYKFEDRLLFQTTQLEAKQLGMTLDELGMERYEKLRQYFEYHLTRDETILQYLFSAGVILTTLLLIHYMLLFIFKRIIKWVEKRKDKYLKGIVVRDFEVMDADDELEIVLKIISGIRILLMLLIASISFPIIFSFFPATEHMAVTLINLVYDPFKSLIDSFVAYIPKLFAILVIVVVVRFILKYLKLFTHKIERGKIKLRGFYPDWASTTFGILKVLIITLSFVMIFPYLPGAQSAVFKGVSVFIGVIFSIGSTSVVGNLVASLVLTYMRPFKIGDRIRVGDIEGEIVEKTAFVLRIKTPKNEYITIPNSNVMSSHITNFNRSEDEGGVILFSDITIGYEVPWRKVHEMLLKAALMTEDLENEPEPFVLQKELGDFSVNYQINAFSKRPLYKDLINSRLHQNIQDIFSEEGIEILSPNYMAQRDGNTSTVPSVSVKKDEPLAD